MKEENQDSQSILKESRAGNRETYSTPVLTCHGRLAELIGSSLGSAIDSEGNFQPGNLELKEQQEQRKRKQG